MSVQYDIKNHGIAVLLDAPRHGCLVGETAGAGDIVVQFLVAGLEANLDMVQPRLLEGPDPFIIHAHAGGDQVAVVTQPPGFGDEVFQVLAHQGFAAGEPQLRRAHVAGLLQYPEPVRRGEFIRVAGDIHRIGAVRALQRTAVSQFRQQPERFRV